MRKRSTLWPIEPSAWAEVVAKAWVAIKPGKEAKVAVGSVPLRPTGSGVMSKEPKTDTEAFEFGMESVR